MRHTETPFPTAWWGIGLEAAGLSAQRPDRGTYAQYDYHALPELPCTIEGTFEWLRTYAPCDLHVGVERSDSHAVALSSLQASAREHAVALPPDLVRLMADPALIARVRSTTDCFIDLCAAPVLAPAGDGWLVRFLADSQGCLFWYVYVPTGQARHCVVVSPGYYGLPEEQWQDVPPDPGDIRYCAESFEAFVCRFVIENEIWFLAEAQEPLGPLEQAYVERYRTR